MNKFLFFLLIFFIGLLSSCNDDDIRKFKTSDDTVLNRETRFFYIEKKDILHLKNSKNIDFNFIENLKNFNRKEEFISRLSDTKGIPLWEFTEVTSSSFHKNNESDFLIVPLTEDKTEHLSSLMYIKYPNSQKPQIYTITNDELHSIVLNQNIDKNDRENILMTFFYFDQKVFGEDRKYTNIPIDLFDNIPKSGTEHNHNHEHSDNELNNYKEFSFKIKSKKNSINKSMEMVCVDYFHCTGCQGPCDYCHLCVSTKCYKFGGGSNSGGSGGSNNGDNYPPVSGGGGGSSNNNQPWYTHYPDYRNYHPKLRQILEILNTYNLYLDQDREITYLNSINNSQVFNQFVFSTNESYEYAKFVRDAIIYFCNNRNEIVEPQNFMSRLTNLEQYLYDNPYAISDIPCNQIPLWQDVVQHQVPQSVKNKLQNLNDTHPNRNYVFAIQNIENAKGSLVNNDYFAVTFDHLPNKPAPHQNQQFTPQELLQYVRKNINDFIDTSLSEFSPSTFTGIDEGAIWYSNNPMNAIVHIEITGNDGSVIVSGHQSNSNDSHWIFSTIQTPFVIVTPGADGLHPVSGNRKFGLKVNSNGSYTIYTRGVDRVQDRMDIAIVGQQFMFNKADQLWQSFQEGLRSFIQNNNTYANTVIKETPIKWRPNWTKVRDVLIKNQPLSTLGCQ